MKMSLIDTYLLTNKTAVKAAIKLSVSVWGALFIALLLGLEHPIWSMTVSYTHLRAHETRMFISYAVFC